MSAFPRKCRPPRRRRRRSTRAARRLFLVGLLAASVVGCGSAGETALSGPVQTPSGYGSFNGSWYTLMLPKQWPASVTRVDAHTATMAVVPPGAGTDSAGTAKTTYQLPRVEIGTIRAAGSSNKQEYDAALARLQKGALLPLPDGHYITGTSTTASVRVPGATEARMVTTVDKSLGLHSISLIVLAPAGATSVQVLWTGQPRLLDPTAIVHSFRLTAS